MQQRTGFVGLGVMGQPMALNLLLGGGDLLVWNRSAGRADLLARAGAEVAGGPREVFAGSDTVLLMLSDDAAVDEVLGRGTPAFTSMLRDHTVVLMGTHAPAYSRGLEKAVHAAGGAYVEAPVSGSRGPAESGDLVAMLSGSDPDAVERVRVLLAPLVRHTVDCGPVPGALTTKLAVNAYMITMLTGLVEAVHLADRSGLERSVLAEVLLGGPMAAPLLRTKLDKLIGGDVAVQAAVADVAKNTGLITAAARDAGAATPLADACDRLFGRAVALGDGAADLIAVLRVLEDAADL